MVILIIALWLGSAAAGWNNYSPWLLVPVAIFGLIAAQRTDQLRRARNRNGLRHSGFGDPGSMAAANMALIGWNLFQHSIIFCIFAGLHAIFN